MNKILLALVAGAVMGMAVSPASAIVACSGGGTVNLGVGVEQVESFCSGTEYEFIFTIAAGGSEYLDMALGGNSGDTYSAELKANPGGYDVTTIYPAGTSTHQAIGPGTWNLFVTLSAAADPFGGFELSDSALDLSIPTSLTPLPATWTMLIAGFVGLGFLAFRGSKKNAASLVAT